VNKRALLRCDIKVKQWVMTGSKPLGKKLIGVTLHDRWSSHTPAHYVKGLWVGVDRYGA
jgi:hypothetical protein